MKCLRGSPGYGCPRLKITVWKSCRRMGPETQAFGLPARRLSSSHRSEDARPKHEYHALQSVHSFFQFCAVKVKVKSIPCLINKPPRHEDCGGGGEWRFQHHFPEHTKPFSHKVAYSSYETDNTNVTHAGTKTNTRSPRANYTDRPTAAYRRS
jgi:hypothetical protein